MYSGPTSSSPQNPYSDNPHKILFVAIQSSPQVSREDGRRGDRAPVGHTRQPAGLAIVSRRSQSVIVVGLSMTFRVYQENTFASATIQVTSEQRVISTGPYAVVRHPMYASGLVYLIGMPLALGSYRGLLVLAATAPVLIWRLLDEEKLLARSLPGYMEYQTKVRWRLIPKVF